MLAFFVLVNIAGFIARVSKTDIQATGDADAMGVAALEHLVEQYGEAFDPDRLRCHLALEKAVWGDSRDFYALSLGGFLTVWLADDWPLGDLYRTRGMAELFERGYWGDGENPA